MTSFKDWKSGIVHTNKSLRLAVKHFHHNPCEALMIYGNFSNWDVSEVTDMQGLFSHNYDFNEDISTWDVSRVINMKSMFYGASKFNQDISRWNVSKVTDMQGLFCGASKFNQDISRWNVSQATNMGSMFQGASEFNQDISRWDVSQVSNMNFMFLNAYKFNQDISVWNVSMVIGKIKMFQHGPIDTGLEYFAKTIHDFFKSPQIFMDIRKMYAWQRRKNFTMFLVHYGYFSYLGRYSDTTNHIFDIFDIDRMIMEFV